jgi:hypothetical protein
MKARSEVGWAFDLGLGSFEKTKIVILTWFMDDFAPQKIKWK